MKPGLKWSTVMIALAAIAAVAVISPALGDPPLKDRPPLKTALKKFVKKQVAKQIANARGPAGANGTNGTNGLDGADGTARAYGAINAAGGLSRSKNVTGVTNPATGTFCIALATGIDASTTGAVLTPDFSQDSTSATARAHVEWYSPAINCPGGQLEVKTFIVNGDGVVSDNEGFFFVVP